MNDLIHVEFDLEIHRAPCDVIVFDIVILDVVHVDHVVTRIRSCYIVLVLLTLTENLYQSIFQLHEVPLEGNLYIYVVVAGELGDFRGGYLLSERHIDGVEVDIVLRVQEPHLGCVIVHP